VPNLNPADPSGRAAGGVEAVLFYLAAYGAMTLGAFGVLAVLNTTGRRGGGGGGLARPAPAPPRPAPRPGPLLLIPLAPPPAAGRFHGEVLAVLWGDDEPDRGDRPAVPRAGRDRCAQRGRRRLLLPADRRRDVPAQRPQAAGPATRLGRAGDAGGLCHSDDR